jgi:hypothetical protein
MLFYKFVHLPNAASATKELQETILEVTRTQIKLLTLDTSRKLEKVQLTPS